jgi:sugar/nucleoside kinase (ribokinase family)
MAGNQQLLITHGDRGAMELRRDRGRLRARRTPAIPPPNVVDATGAGDVFAGAWLASRLLAPGAPSDRHLLVASAMAGLSVSVGPLAGVPGLNDLCNPLAGLSRRATQ